MIVPANIPRLCAPSPRFVFGDARYRWRKLQVLRVAAGRLALYGTHRECVLAIVGDEFQLESSAEIVRSGRVEVLVVGGTDVGDAVPAVSGGRSSSAC